MKILLFGKNGQVGWELNRALQPFGNIISLGREEADFTNPESLRAIIQTTKPDVIVNAVAYTAVDKAESEPDLVETVNAITPGVLAEETLKIDALLVHYSTDYVFDGTKNTPYVETDKPNLLNVYGRSKLAGEVAIQKSGCNYLIFRTSWVYASRGHNFLLTILKLAKERDELSIVADQVGSPTSARLIADITLISLRQSIEEIKKGGFKSGLYHLTSSGNTSWHGFAKEIVNVASKKLELKIKGIKEITTIEYPTPASRPKNSQLKLKKLEDMFNVEMPCWESTLDLCIEEIS